MCNSNGSCVCARQDKFNVSAIQNKFLCPICPTCIGQDCFVTIAGTMCSRCLSDQVSLASACTKCIDPTLTLIGDSCYMAGTCAFYHQVYTYDEFVNDDITSYVLSNWSAANNFPKQNVFIMIDLSKVGNIGPNAENIGIWKSANDQLYSNVRIHGNIYLTYATMGVLQTSLIGARIDNMKMKVNITQNYKQGTLSKPYIGFLCYESQAMIITTCQLNNRFVGIKEYVSSSYVCLMRFSYTTLVMTNIRAMLDINTSLQVACIIWYCDNLGNDANTATFYGCLFSVTIKSRE